MRIYAFTSLTLALLISACGEEAQNSEDPFAPNTDPEFIKQDENKLRAKDIKKAGKVRHQKSDAKSSTDTEESDTSTTDKVPTEDTAAEACLAGNCSTPVSLQFAFTAPLDISPFSCSVVSKSRAIVLDQQMWVFSRANCGTANYLYMQRLNNDTSAVSDPVLISPNCSTNTNYIFDFDVATSGKSVLVVYSCRLNSTTYRVDTRQIQFDGTLGATKVLEASTTQFDIEIEWNQGANSYGLVRNSKFQRLQENGTVLGGPIVIPSKNVAQVKVINDHWTIIQEDSNRDYRRSVCSKVSPTGVLSCNGNSLGDSNFRFADASQIINVQNDYYAVMKASLFNFNFDTCSVFNESNTVSPANVPNNYTDVQLFGTGIILNEIALNLFQGRYGLIMGVYKRGPQLSLLSESSIVDASYNQITQAEMFIANEQLNIFYIKSGRTYFVSSLQKVE